MSLTNPHNALRAASAAAKSEFRSSFCVGQKKGFGARVTGSCSLGTVSQVTPVLNNELCRLNIVLFCFRHKLRESFKSRRYRVQVIEGPYLLFEHNFDLGRPDLQIETMAMRGSRQFLE